MGGVATAEPASGPRDFSGWRGGIGITFGTPSRDIADVTEMGYEIVWGGEDPRAVRALGLSVFRYWNSIVETSLKGPGYDFSRMPDKDAGREAGLRRVDGAGLWREGPLEVRQACAITPREPTATSTAAWICRPRTTW